MHWLLHSHYQLLGRHNPLVATVGSLGCDLWQWEPISQGWSRCWGQRVQCRRCALRWVGQRTTLGTSSPIGYLKFLGRTENWITVKLTLYFLVAYRHQHIRFFSFFMLPPAHHSYHCELITCSSHVHSQIATSCRAEVFTCWSGLETPMHLELRASKL